MMTANGEVQTREEAAVYVKELDLFVTVVLLQETPAVLSLGKLWVTVHISSKNGKRIDCNVSNYVPFVVPGTSKCSFSTTPSSASSSSSSLESTSENRDSVSENRDVEAPESGKELEV